MADRLREIPAKVLEWWNKFTARQKTIIIAIVAVVIFAFAIIIYAFTRPNYTRLGTYENTTVAAEIIKILDDAGIAHKESADLLTIEVDTGQLPQANYAIAVAGYMPDELKYENYVSSGMSATNSDKVRQYSIYLQRELEQMFGSLNSVKKVSIHLHIPEQDGTIMRQQQESSAYIQLTLNGEFSSANAVAMAKAAATFLGSETTANITIVDQDTNLLFAGGDDYSTAGIANSMQELQNQAESMVANQVKKVLFATNQYNNVEVASHLVMDYSSYERTRNEYYAPDGRTEGMLTNEKIYESEGTNGVAGIPGTDSNGEGGAQTTYVNPDSATSEYSESESDRSYMPNQDILYQVSPAGSIDYSASSMSIALISYHNYYEKDVKDQGLLDGISWSEFKAQNSADIRLTVDDEFYDMAANATGIDRERITIIAYESPVFFDKEGLNVQATDVISIFLIILILALLALVVLRSMRAKQEASEEEELSVESMLQSTADSVEDIDVETKSETRKMVEKFVDDNPEAAANLLKNWLTEDWG